MTWEEDCLHWRGRILTGEFAHWCDDWDLLPVDETTREIQTCTCNLEEIRKLNQRKK